MNERSWKTKIGTVLVITALTLAGSVSHAQLPGHKQLPGIGGNKQSGGGDVKGFSISLSESIGSCLHSRLLYLDAQKKLAEALDLKTDEYTKASESARAGEGATSDKQIEALKSSKVSPEAKKAMDDALAQSKELSAESKKKYAEGAGKFALGVGAEAELVKPVTSLVQQGQNLVQSASPMEKVKIIGMVKPAGDLLAIVTGDMKELGATFSEIVKFAQKQNVEIPGADAIKNKLGGL